ncbi:acyl-CoA dehydrogenase family protein [Frankia sp. Cas3]|uniref:acyl-CoA dehydrogenase family protein n=1 Tax=Frankia sp. Cas3 TaxID=3073926 RepID=UPI002AD397E2|nr:acyl-CoA dehydrogenase family protein [Frankia sp. Cas3]
MDETPVQLRARFAEFLDTHDPGPAPKDVGERLAWQRSWAALLVDEGFAAPGWPREWGGMELSLAHQVAYTEELSRRRLPAHPSGGTFVVGPTLIVHGTREQRERYLRPALRGDEIWCQGFSEPDAGSDLPSLRTRARRDGRDGDRYVVTGRKVWITNARAADRMFALVRTGTQEQRQDGITYLLIDMHAPGVTVTPLVDMTGNTSFCEVTFDEVRVPISDRVGEEGGGWRIARTSLGHERSTAFITQASKYRRVLDELVALAIRLDRAGDPLVRQALARAETDLQVVRLGGLRVLGDLLRGREPGPAASLGRLVFTEFEQRLHALAVEITGRSAVLAPGKAHPVEGGRWSAGLLATRASTIGAGTAEIQRNTIAEQVLGLPREPAP